MTETMTQTQEAASMNDPKPTMAVRESQQNPQPTALPTPTATPVAPTNTGTCRIVPPQPQPSVPLTVARRALGHMRKQRRKPKKPVPPSPTKPRYPVLIQPAPAPSMDADANRPTTFYDLPAELRVEIYKLALSNTVQHIGSSDPAPENKRPHPFLLTSRNIRAETLPIIYALCPIRAKVTDFNFDGMLAFMGRLPPSLQASLAKNSDIVIKIISTEKTPKEAQFGASLRRWLHLRADTCRPQPALRYEGGLPVKGVASDMRRRLKRMTEEGKRKELEQMLKAIGVV